MTDQPDVLAGLDKLRAAIATYDDPRRAAAEWKQVFNQLQKAGVSKERATPIVGMRDVARLAALLDELRSPAPVADDSADRPDADTCRKALHAFRKRLSLTVLDDESKLGRGPLSKGASRETPAITPPTEWPDAVWKELARQGRLRYIGDGLYQMSKKTT